MALRLTPARVRKALAYAVNVPLHALGTRVPRRRDRWVFGAWMGSRYADNPRYFLEYMQQHHPEIECIWLATSPGALRDARAAGAKAVRTYSLRGYWYSANAQLAVVSGGIGDINRYVRPPHLLNLWHGIPLKRIQYDSQPVAERLRAEQRFARVFPFAHDQDEQDLVVSSQWEADRLASAFRRPMDRIHITGQPRNDQLVRSEYLPRANTILYSPTFRDQDPNGPCRELASHIPAIEAMLERCGATLHVRRHPNTPPVPEELHGSDRILFDSELALSGDATAELPKASILITDYSSIYLDFLLLDRPVCFLPYDREAYREAERDFYLDYADPAVTPGPKAASWPELISILEALVLGEDDDYISERAAARARFHTYTDGANSARVYDVARQIAERR